MSDQVKYPKRLIEVDLPIKKISNHARREKSIRHGHISTLHIWWARRPLAACRAVICAALWPDPAPDPDDPPCPDKFRQDAVTILRKFQESKDPLGVSDREEDLDNPLELRNALLDFIADFANWDNSTKKEYLETARSLTQSAHEALGGLPGTRPLLVDPFAGGGAIPLEALRVGADAFASDLNPVAVLLNKVVLEYIPRYGQKLADEVRRWGEWIKTEAEKELAEFYPKDSDGATPIAYLWARTIVCEGPGCGAEVPLMRSMWLSKRKNHQVALRMVPGDRRVEFEIVDNVATKDVGDGTVRRGSATCPICGYTTPVASVRKQLKARRGGAADARLFAVVTTRPGQRGRFYRLPTEQDLDAIQKAAGELEQRKAKHKGSLSLVPDEPTPQGGGHRAVSSLVIYGMQAWSDLFTPRQSLALTTLARLVRETEEKLAEEHENGLAAAVQTCLALAADRQADATSSLCRWHITGEKHTGTFGRQALPMVWDFSEVNVLSKLTGGFPGALEWVARVCEANASQMTAGCAELDSAITHPLPDEFAQCFFTDPPYYDAIPYADVSDFFYVWLKRTLDNQYADLFKDNLTPKSDQIIVLHPDSLDEKNDFEQKMTKAVAEGRRILAPDGIGVVVFAHKTTSGWEAMLQAMLDAGWIITASWPIDTEMGARMNAMKAATLASSVHLVCRPRENPDGSLDVESVGDWRDVLAELPQRIHDWLPRLAREGVVGADAIFSCLGPALEIFSRYSHVEKASGEVVSLREYLEHVWAAVAREALNTIFEGADATGFEEDARLTAMWLWTLPRGVNGNEKSRSAEESTKTVKGEFVLEYDAARKIAQGLGAHMEKLGSVVEIKGNKARLLPVEVRAQHLFGKEGGQVRRGRKKRIVQQVIMDGDVKQPDEKAIDFDEIETPLKGETVLDQVHQAMILFAGGRSEALKSFLVEEGTGNDQRFWQLAQALSALYPKISNEKRWVDGLLARKKGMGF